MRPRSFTIVDATLYKRPSRAREFIAEALSLARFPKMKVADSTFDFFTLEDSDLLLAAGPSAEERRGPALRLSQRRKRAGEQLAFEWQDQDLHNKRLVFRQPSTHVIVGPTKSGKERKVPLTASLEAALRRRVDRASSIGEFGVLEASQGDPCVTGSRTT